MKLVVAVVRHEKVNDVLVELFKADVQGLTISEVRGHGGELDQELPRVAIQRPIGNPVERLLREDAGQQRADRPAHTVRGEHVERIVQ